MAQLVEQTISEFLEQRVAQVPHNEALVYTNQKWRMTYQQFNTHVNDVAKALMATGLNKGEHFSVWTTNVAVRFRVIKFHNIYSLLPNSR